MASTLPISNIVYGTLTLQPQAAQPQSTSTGLIIGDSGFFDSINRYRVYSSPADVAATFGADAPETLAAQEAFAPTPQISQVIIGQYFPAGTNGRLIGAPVSAPLSSFTAITAGELSIHIDGVAETVSGLNFSTAANLDGVAGVVAAALSALSTPAFCIYDPAMNTFGVLSSTEGTTSSVSFATSTSTPDLSLLLGINASSSGAYLAPGVGPETAVHAVQVFDDLIGQKFYGLTFAVNTPLVDADHTAVAGYIESGVNRHYYFVTTNEGAVLVPSSTTDIAYVLNSLGYDHTAVQYSSTNPYAGCSLMSRAINIDYTGSNTASIVALKTQPGVIPENLSQTQFNTLAAKKANVYVAYDNGTAYIQNGTSASGNYIDTIVGTDAFFIQCQNNLLNAVVTTPTKIPQTDAGMDILANALKAACKQFVANGLLAPGIWTQPGFGTLVQGAFLADGFYVYAPPVASQTSANRAARKSVLFQVAAKLAGAVQTVNFAIAVNI